ncbi:MEKHLA domain-containing protein [Candidatus Woesearchaeota archaeon]|nr:MEKHLA domain-containing protein [Candidatus Woesearchaeota archaeon]
MAKTPNILLANILWHTILNQNRRGIPVSFFGGKPEWPLPYGDKPHLNHLFTSPTAILAYDPGGRIIFFNRGAEGIFGYTTEEAMGMPYSLLVPQEEFRARENFLQELMNSGKADGKAEYVSLQSLRKDGGRVNVFGYVFAYPYCRDEKGIAAVFENGGLLREDGID